MCGIAGSVRFGAPALAPDKETVAQMMAMLSHRGPDGDGIHVQGGAVLGHRRLSIIDLSQAATQPMANEDGTVWATFNGEIYNYRELGSDLRSRGHRFHSQSDTEILLHGYEEWGMAGLLERLRGMFAFGLYDAQAESAGSQPWFYLARDRVGIKPLYYCQQGRQGKERILFASEVRPLRRAMAGAELDRDALAGFLCLGSIPSPHTYIRGIECLPPGAFLAVGPGGARVEQYWSLPYASGAPEDLRALFRDTVERHLLADVPLGVFLSGGLDSGALAAAISRLRETPALTLTVTFPEAEFSEAEEARKAAVAFGTNHVEVDISDRTFLDEMPRILRALDQPTADGVNTYFVSKAAREAGLKVVLSGLGGDEIFFGYRHYHLLTRASALVGSVAGLPAAVRDVLVSLAQSYASGRKEDRWGRLRYLRGRRFEEGLYLLFRGFFDGHTVCDLMGIGEGELNRILESEFADIRFRGDLAAGDIHRVHYLEMQRYLHDQLLRDSDVFSMAHSIELRVPLLDHVLVEHCARIAGSQKVSKTVNKPLLLQAAEHPALREIAARKKRGFTFPFAHWMRRHAGELEEMATSGGPLNRRAVKNCWRQFREGRAHWSRAWSTTVLAVCGAEADGIPTPATAGGIAAS
jgi:asparagine synthase (glutamine-hydrolysing)